MIQELIDSLKELIEWAFLSVLNWVMDGLGALLASIPAPSFLDDMPNLLSGMDSGAAFFLQAAEIPFGFGVIGAALVTRFLIRRLPVIG